MGNMTAVAVNTLTANSSKAITADVNTSVTGAKTYLWDLGGVTDRAILRVENKSTVASETITVTFTDGTNPPAFRAGLTALTKSALATASISIFGPLESARYAGTDGKITVAICCDTTNASGSWSVESYKLPAC